VKTTETHLAQINHQKTKYGSPLLIKAVSNWED
jgi:hypothetical protein